MAMTAASEIGPLLGSVLAADRQTDEFFASGGLHDAVRGLVAVARQRGLTAVVGASRAGDRLVGAMLLEADDLHAWRPGDGRVLIVDAVVVTDLGVRTRAAEVAALGAAEAHGAVLRILGEPTAGADEPLQSLTAIG